MMFILIIILIFFGSKKIPELARGLGKGMREFRDASNSIREEITRETSSITQEARKIREEIKSQVDLKALDAETQSISAEISQIKEEIMTPVDLNAIDSEKQSTTSPAEIAAPVTSDTAEAATQTLEHHKGPIARLDPDDVVSAPKEIIPNKDPE